MAAILLASGAPGERYATPSSRIMIHNPSWSLTSDSMSAENLSAQASESQRQREHFLRALSRQTGQPEQDLATLLSTDTFFTAQEARDFGVIDDLLVDISGHQMSRKCADERGHVDGSVDKAT
eukprot:TRINITY_DN38954_c0_g1_i1.p1 TRINITY_DN38954_c0_g1~~TRINITY_DN38954_c0_g1_i1.p1  ORF type:complete len:139 (+),score=19.78 TRINITY_DN38954_c0_g1_i1:49-417(+)